MREMNCNPVAKMKSYRLMSAATTLLVMMFVSGFFTALVVAGCVFLTAHLYKFRFVLPKVLYDAGGYPACWAENLLPVGIMGLVAVLFFISGHGLGALALCAAAVMDLMRERIDFIGLLRAKFIKKGLR